MNAVATANLAAAPHDDATAPSTGRVTPAGAANGDVPAQRLDDLAQIIRAYNQVTENLQRSHEHLANEVLRLQQQLASADAQLQRSKRLAALGEMAAGIAHEIRNPLGAIQLYAGMLEQDLGQLVSPDAAAPAPDPQGMLDTSRKIASAVRGLNGIVTDVVAFAREIQPRPAVMSVEGLFTRTIETLEPMIRAAHVQVHLTAAEDLFIHADVELLHQAMINLVRNAIEAMSEQRPPRRLTLTSTLREQRVELTIRDTGPGIDPAHIDRIFNPFYTTRSTGTGLGLAIVHRIIDAHQGSISVHNDGGAVFEISLPRNLATPSDSGVHA